MPVMDGIEATRLIHQRHEGKHPHAKVVFVTAHALEDFKIECKKAGGCDFLPKPASITDIRICFKRIFAANSNTNTTNGYQKSG